MLTLLLFQCIQKYIYKSVLFHKINVKTETITNWEKPIKITHLVKKCLKSRTVKFDLLINDFKSFTNAGSCIF